LLKSWLFGLLHEALVARLQLAFALEVLLPDLERLWKTVLGSKRASICKKSAKGVGVEVGVGTGEGRVGEDDTGVGGVEAEFATNLWRSLNMFRVAAESLFCN
jgi:hypothetical protein